MLDQTDRAILLCLQENSRLMWQEVGKAVHLTGQAVAARVRKMQEQGIIEAFTVQVDHTKLGKPLLALITVFMKSANHAAFKRFLSAKESIVEAHRVSGEGCYWLKIHVTCQHELNALLDEILQYGNYRISLSIDKVK